VVVVLKSVVIVVKNVLTSGIEGCNMNERIKELAEQAGVLTDFGEDIKVGRWGIGGNYKQMQTFTELIVRECADTAYQSLYEDRVFDDVPANIRRNVMDAIKQRFGVE
jgi:hypothetical protein